jgi:hypothetical protein
MAAIIGSHRTKYFREKLNSVKLTPHHWNAVIYRADEVLWGLCRRCERSDLA